GLGGADRLGAAAAAGHARRHGHADLWPGRAREVLVTCRSDSAATQSWRYCPDDPPLSADRLRAVVRWLAIDEITAEGPDIEFTVTTSALGLTPRISQGGVMGLVGNPARLYPGLDSNVVEIAYTVAARGYITRTRTAKLGPVAGFPGSFVPREEDPLALHRTPFVIRGRIGKIQPGSVEPLPLPLVPISLNGVWSTFPA